MKYVSIESVTKLLLDIQSHLLKEHKVKIKIDPTSRLLLHTLVGLALKADDNTITTTTKNLNSHLQSNHRTVRDRMTMLAEMGLIRMRSGYDAATKKREASQIDLNPYLVTLFTTRKAGVAGAASKHFSDLFLRRMQYEDDMQGFEKDVPYGEPEDGIDEIFADAPAEGLAKMVAKENEEKAFKLQDSNLWRKRDDRFVAGCAALWTKAQTILGYAEGSPNWAGNNIPPAARAARKNLTQTFQKYGCRKAAIAWYVFVGGKPELRENGQPKFSIYHPHRQSVSMDKKPKHYVDHFRSIEQDEHFMKCDGPEWKTVEPILRHYFGDLLDVGRRT